MPRIKRQTPIEQYTVMSMAEVGKHLRISPQRVCQLEKSALAKLRREFAKLKRKHLV